MKKLVSIFLFIISMFIFTSCGASYPTSYKELSKVKSEYGSYIAFGYDGIVIDNKYNKIKYDDLFGDKTARISDIRKIGNYAYISAIKDYYDDERHIIKDRLYICVYNLDDDTYNTKSFDYNGQIVFSFIDNHYFILEYGTNKIDKVYALNLDFDICDEQIITDDPDVYSSVLYCNNKIYFKEEKNRNFICMWEFYNETFNNMEDKSEIDYVLRYGETKQLNYYENRREEPDIPDIDYVKKNKYTSIFKKYCGNAEVSSVEKYDNNDGNYYYLVSTNHWVFTGITDMSPTQGLEPLYIFLYDKETNSAKYVGYSMSAIYLLYLR